MGCTLFENGDPGGWSSFDLEPIAGWFKNYLSPASAPPAPSNVTATVGNALVTLVMDEPAAESDDLERKTLDRE